MNDRPDLSRPPHNTEYENAVLGALLRWPDRIDDLGLSERDFFLSDHRTIFAAIRDCVEADGRADVVLVADRLSNAGKLDQVGGLPYLVELATNVPGASNLGRYAQGVIEKARERALMAAASEIAVIAESPSGSYAEKLAAAQSLLMGIETTQATGEAQTLREAMRAMIERVERVSSGTEKTITTGFRDLDKKIVGLGAGDMVVVAGRPSMGKTALALQIADHVSETEPVLIFSLEMGAEQLAMRQAASKGKIDLMSLRSGDLDDDGWQRLTYALGKLQSRQIYIDDRGGLSMHQIRARARQTKRKHGLGAVVIDYIGLIHGEGENRVNVVSEISRNIKAMARELGVPVIALSQLNRGLANRNDKRPQMSDLRDSGSIEQDADLILLLHRDDYYNPDSEWKGVAECIIAKQRNGPTGMVPLAFMHEHALFGDFAGRYDPDARESKPARKGFA